MSGELLTLLGVVVVALSGLAGTVAASWISKRASDRAQIISERVVNREDFESLMDRKDAEQNRLDKRLTDLEVRLEAEVEAREKAEARAIRAEERADAAERRATRLELRVSQLEQVLRDHDIPVPPLPA